jgi:hypothetical protein
MCKCERKVVRKFALETEKLMHSLYPTDKANKVWCAQYLGKRKIVPQMTMLTCTLIIDIET